MQAGGTLTTDVTTIEGSYREMKRVTRLLSVILTGACLASASFTPGTAQETITAEAIANADLNKGKIVFLRCRSCHSLEEGGRNKTGPNLWGLFGREVGTLESFATGVPGYSQALKDADFIWTPDQLNQWLIKPKDFLPGNNMAFIGLNREDQRVDLIAYIAAETGGLPDMSSAPAEAPAAEDESTEASDEAAPGADEQTEAPAGENASAESSEAE